MVQCDENNKKNGEAYKAGYKTICDIGEERIRRVGAAIKEKNRTVDTGFRVLHLDESNMTDIYYSAEEYSQNFLSVIGIQYQTRSKCR